MQQAEVTCPAMEVEAMPIKAEDEEPLKVVDAEDAVVVEVVVEVVVKAVGPWVDRTTPRRKSLICWSP